MRAPPLRLLGPSLTAWRLWHARDRSLRRRWHLPGHPAEQLEPHLRRVCGAHLHPVAALRPQPKLACQLRGGAHVHRVQARAPLRRAKPPSLTARRPADASTTSACRRVRVVPCCSCASDAPRHRRRLWSSPGRCHDDLAALTPLYLPSVLLAFAHKTCAASSSTCRPSVVRRLTNTPCRPQAYQHRLCVSPSGRCRAALGAPGSALLAMRVVLAGGVALASQLSPQLSRSRRRPLAPPALVRPAASAHGISRHDSIPCVSQPATPACRRPAQRSSLVCTAARTSAIKAKQRRCGRTAARETWPPPDARRAPSQHRDRAARAGRSRATRCAVGEQPLRRLLQRCACAQPSV